MRLLVIFFILAVSLVTSACAATGVATVTFVHPDPDGTDFVVEQKQADGTWREVASGPVSPIVFQIPQLKAGEYVMRVRSRVTVAGVVHVSEPSNEAPAIVVPGKPGTTSTSITKS
jgi:hypothetical protein